MIKTRPHYVKENLGSRIPRRWVYLDTEAHLTKVGDRTEQRWRLGVTSFEHNDNNNATWGEPHVQSWFDPLDMWDYISDCARTRCRTIVVAHNIGYDLRLSNALVHLPALGWEIDIMSVGGRNLTVSLRRDTASLVLIDFMAWLPQSLESIGLMVGLGKLPLPDELDTDDVWLARCLTDVEILRRANRTILDWVESGDLGNWQKTGAGMAWTNWRHRHMDHKVLVNADEVARDLEVIGAGTGRCEAWRHGKLSGGPWYEWDLPMAYPSACLDAQLPTMLLGHDWSPVISRYSKPIKGHRALVTATVTTDEPCLPVKSDQGWLWPVGTFTSTWWDGELQLALEFGATAELHHAVLYKAAPALDRWARWVLPIASGSEAAYSPVQVAAARHWARALIGRFGAKYPIWEEYGAAPVPGIELSECYDMETGRQGHALTVAGISYMGFDEDWVADANPAIMGAVVSECRIRLWRIIQAAGPDNVVYCDTDSVIVNKTGNRVLQSYVDQGHGWGLRTKQTLRSLTIMGPRQMVINGRGRIAGVPNRAVQVEPGKWAGERWDGMQSTLSSGSPDVVVVRDATWRVNGTDRRRLHLEDGRTAALRVSRPV
jgi:hypothetical protein